MVDQFAGMPEWNVADFLVAVIEERIDVGLHFLVPLAGFRFAVEDDRLLRRQGRDNLDDARWRDRQ